MSDGSLRLLSLAQLDSLVDAGRFPADFWTCVHRADWSWEHLGQAEDPVMTPWPIET